jgi:membrane protease YdiL (CAAX protease family)
MYIEQGYRGLHEGWRYVVGFIIVFFAWQILGGIPLIFALIVKSNSFTAITNDMGAMAQMLGLNWFFCLVMLTFVFAMAGLYVAVKFLHKLPWLHFTTARNKVDWNRIIFAFLLWGILSVSMILVDVFLTPEHYVLQFDLIPFLILLLLSIVLLPIQTSFEEYFTRGYLMQGIGIAAKNRWLPFLVSSTLFGILHIFNPEVQKLGYGILVYYIGTGFSGNFNLDG